MRNRQPASSSAFNAAAAQGVVRVFNQTPVPLPPKRRPCISNLPAEDPLALCEVDRDKASLALPRRSAGGVAVTSPHYTVNVSPARRRKLQLTFTFGNRLATVRTGWNSRAFCRVWSRNLASHTCKPFQRQEHSTIPNNNNKEA